MELTYMTGEFDSIPITNIVAVKYNATYLNTRCFILSSGDKFTVNAYGIKKDCGIKIKDIELGTQMIWPNVICTKKIKRKWWQIWKPRYIAATFRYVG